MNTKLNLASIVVTIFLIATACSPEMSSLPIVDEAPAAEENYGIAALVPLTAVDAGENVYDYEQEVWAYPSHRLHSACASADIHRQSKCEEQELNTVILHSNNANANTQDYPSQKLHSHCVSEDVQRQYSCMD
jgi:hypothetical protein